MRVQLSIRHILHYVGLSVIPDKDRDNWEDIKTNDVKPKKTYKVVKSVDDVLMSDGKYYVRDQDEETNDYILDASQQDNALLCNTAFLTGLDDVLIAEHNAEQEEKPANQRIKLKEANYKALKPVFAKGAPYKGKGWNKAGGDSLLRGLKGVSERSRAEYWKVMKKSAEIEAQHLSPSR